jgi:hypothetical protein
MDFIVKKSRWLRGTPNSMLLGDSNKMCCLGFVCRQLGLKPKDIMFKVMPSDIESEDNDKETKELQKKLKTSIRLLNPTNGDTPFTNKAVAINDNELITDKERIEKLTKLFKTKKHNITFV